MSGPDSSVENFWEAFGQFILEEDSIPTVSGDGRFPFISIEDIATAAFDALTRKDSPNSDFYLLGPDLYSYDEVGRIYIRNFCSLTFRRLPLCFQRLLGGRLSIVGLR